MICLRSIANSQDQPVSLHPKMIHVNQICKKYSLENSQDKKTSDGTCHIF